MARIVTIEFPDEATSAEIDRALQAAEDCARQNALNCRLRTQHPETRRYAWHKIAGAFASAEGRDSGETA
jgi:hypothetical protein